MSTKPPLDLIGTISAVQRNTIEECLTMIDGLIVRGPLPGNGCDKSAERNGLILAYNTLYYMIHECRGNKG